MTRLLFLAIDGLDYEHVIDYDCPCLNKLMEGNQHGELIAIDPDGCNARGEPMTGCVWPTVYRAVPASVHGFTAEKFLAGESATLAATGITVWDILGRQYTLGLMTLAAYAPTTKPLPPINGWAINGFPCVGEVRPEWATPRDLSIPKGFRIEEFVASMKPKPAEFYQFQTMQADEKLAVASVLPRNDVTAIGVQVVDWVSHCTVDRRDVYGFIDDWVECALKMFDPQDFVICSDHGFQKDIGRHSNAGMYVASIPGGNITRTIYDIAPLMLWIAQ